MASTKETRQRGHLGRGALLALLLHAQVFVPLLVLVFIFAAREARQHEDEVDVAFQDVPAEELPADLPSLEDLSHPPKPEPELHQPEVRQKPRKEKDKPKPAKLAEKKPEPEQKKPEPQVTVPPEEKPKQEPPPPAPKPKPEGHEKMVDIDNKDADQQPPPDAKFLAEKNHHTDKETRATETNLEKAQKGSEGTPSAPSDRQDQEVGADKHKVAELENEKSALGRSAPNVTPHAKPELSQDKPAPEEAPKSLLALRDAPRRDHELTPETADPSLPRTPDGNIAMPQDRGARGPKSDPSRLDAGKRMKLRLTSHDYEYLFGADADAERRLAQKERSTKVGRFQKRLDRVKSALENFIPEVQPGNQDSLNTRAAPFAAFIARMHQSIHKLWGFGVLEEWDERSSSNPYNNRNLLTTLEMVLNGDGTLSKVTVVRPSGNLDYDVAAIDVAYSAGPYPDPPREIRSKNGKIYIHWRFYRDERQCATSGVDYYILNTPPKGGDVGPTVGEGGGGGGGEGEGEGDANGERAGAGDAAPAAAGSGAASAAPSAEKPKSASLASPPSPPTVAAAPAAPPAGVTEEAPRRLAHIGHDGAPPRPARMRRFGEGAPGGAVRPTSTSQRAPPGSEPGSKPESAPATAPPRSDDPEALATAQAWFDAFARGDVLAMLNGAVFPFRSTTDRAAARNRGELATMLKTLVEESPEADRAVSVLKLYSAAALRAVIGHLPPGMEEGAGLLFAFAQTKGKDTLILMLGQKEGAAWKATGLARR